MGTALIVGASRGLGLELVRALLDSKWTVIATVRDLAACTDLRRLTGVRIEQLDVCDAAQLEVLHSNIGTEKIDLLFLNAGVFGPSWQTPGLATADELGRLFMTNAIGPIRVAERFYASLNDDHGTVAFMTSRLGSFANPDRLRAGVYKASKAALNHLVVGYAAHVSNPSITVLAIYPGWVKTDMGGEHADIDVETSIRGIIEQLALFKGRGGVHFIGYNGTPLLN